MAELLLAVIRRRWGSMWEPPLPLCTRAGAQARRNDTRDGKCRGMKRGKR